MAYTPGITTFKVNEPIVVQNLADPGFDIISLGISSNGGPIVPVQFPPESYEGYTLSFGTPGIKELQISGIRNLPNPPGGQYSQIFSRLLNIGYSPKDRINFNRLSDQSFSYNENYVKRGITFQVTRNVGNPSGTEPKNYSWSFGGAISYSGSTLTSQILSYNTVGSKTIGLTTSNPWGNNFSRLNLICVNSPKMKINTTIPFGYVELGNTATFSASIIESNTHLHRLRDINYYWIIDGVQYNQQSVSYGFTAEKIVGVTLFYQSNIFSGFSGTTFGSYQVSPPFYDLYVSDTIGNDSWTGKTAGISGTNGPVKTIEKAWEFATGYTGILSNIIIFVRQGTYRYTNKGLYLHGGFTEKNITIRNYENESVIISGGFLIPGASFSAITAGNTFIYNKLKETARSKVYEVDLSSYLMSMGNTFPHRWTGRGIIDYQLPSTPEFFFGQARMNVARWPNIGLNTSPFLYLTSATFESVINSGSYDGGPVNTKAIVSYFPTDSSVINRWAVTGPNSYDGVWIHTFGKVDWYDEIFKLSSLNTANRRITINSEKSVYGFFENKVCDNPPINPNPTPRRWFAFNLPEELDYYNEYYLDRGRKKLYFYPPEDPISGVINPAQRECVLSSIITAGDVAWVPGTPFSGDSGLQYRHPYNINAVYASLLKMYKVLNTKIQGFTFIHCAGSGIEMNTCHGVTIENCTISEPRKHGAVVIGGANNTINSCNIIRPGLNGVILSGGNRQSLIPANNVLKNSRIIGVGHHACSASRGIFLTGVGNKVIKNIIADSSSKGMEIAGNDHIVEYNNFTRLIQGEDDTGCIYMANNVSDRGTTIRYNFFNEISTYLPGGPFLDYTINASGGCPNPPIKTQIQAAIYIDEFNSGVNVISNVFNEAIAYSAPAPLGTAVLVNHGLDNVVKNNIIIKSPNGFVFHYSTRNLWNSSSKALLSGQPYVENYGLQLIKNIDNDPWYENGGPTYVNGVLFKGRNYTPYSYHRSGYGYFGDFVDAQFKGLLNKVDIKGSVWGSAYPDLNSMIDYNSDTKVLSFNPTYTQKNEFGGNLLLDVDQSYKIIQPTINEAQVQVNSPNLSGYSLGYFISNEYFVEGYNNYKLTENGLRFVRETIPEFQNIPFEEIPVY